MWGLERDLRRRFWVEIALAFVACGLLILTLLRHDWLEALGVDPDGGSGVAEWLIVAGLFAISAGLGVSARLEWVRAVRPARTTT